MCNKNLGEAMKQRIDRKSLFLGFVLIGIVIFTALLRHMYYFNPPGQLSAVKLTTANHRNYIRTKFLPLCSEDKDTKCSSAGNRKLDKEAPNLAGGGGFHIITFLSLFSGKTSFNLKLCVFRPMF